MVLGDENTDDLEEYAKSVGVDVIDGKAFGEQPEDAIKVYESLFVESDVE